jgi:hypothetical protein
MLLGLLRPTSGHATVAGFRSSSQPDEVKRRVGLVSASAGLYQQLTVQEMLLFFADLYAVPPARARAELERLTGLLKFSVSDFLSGARNLESPDELSVFIARRLMRQFAPSLVWITLHDIDIAHAGTFSLYVDAIRRTDRLCAEIWKLIESEPEYAGKTSMFVLPDFGRDSDESAGGNGFQHHRTGDARSRTTWMLALGPDIRENVLVDRAVDSMDLVPTLGSYFGFSPRFAQGTPLGELF